MTGSPNTASSASAATPVWAGGMLATPLGYQQITSLSAAQTLTVPTNATMAIIRPTTQAVMWRDDGTAPTASIGMPLLVADPPLVVGSNQIKVIQFIQVTSGAVLNISYYK